MKRNPLFIFLILFGVSVPVMHGMKKHWWRGTVSTAWPSIRRWFSPARTIFNISKTRKTGRVKQFFTKKNLKQLKPKISETIRAVKESTQYQDFKRVSDRMQPEKWRRRKDTAEKHLPKIPRYWKNISGKFKQWFPSKKHSPLLIPY